ncbi:MAG TPA: hypothetical protein DDW50_06845 [Firmicutes bacterium]|jgi:hypothetical protein|nr:hypothetical protein [Bacillota bacterium]
MPEITINKGYELYQIITDFGDPLEIFREAFQNAIDENATEVYCNVYELKKMSGSELIIDIWNNGNGLPKQKVACFFDLANSSKVDDNLIPLKGKLGYKGHGSKIFFNSRKVLITSKTREEYWTVELNEPLKQIEQNNAIEYSSFKLPVDCGLELPITWEQGFFVRIIGHLHFNTQHTKYKLNHKNLRDYSKWYTVFGTIRTIFDEKLKNEGIKLYLHGLDIESFREEYNSVIDMDPLPQFKIINNIAFEEIDLGHYFPMERYTDKTMKAYANLINSSKAYYEYYSKMIFKEKVNCSDGTQFNLLINIEGYETKRCYDILLTRRGKSRTEISHTDSERYGVWACKGGVPVQKIDEWIEGAKGTYSFMQAFVDCDKFKLTANRGSINNSELETLEIVKEKLNEIFNNQKIKDSINERVEIEKLENQLMSIEEDGKLLKERYKISAKKRIINLPNGVKLLEPTKRSSGYSESETMVLFINLIANYPKLFNFNLLDYDTTKGIDFVVEDQSNPKYIELKGTLHKKINHPFRHIYKFICYEIDIPEDDIVTDIEDFKTTLRINKGDKFFSFDANFKDKIYKSFQLIPDRAAITSMEILELKSLLADVIGATIS